MECLSISLPKINYLFNDLFPNVYSYLLYVN